MAFLPGISTAIAAVKSAADYVIGAGVATAILLVAYEGVPIVKDIPLIGWLPIVGDLAVGRVQREADKAVKAATADLVARAEYDAVAAALARKELEAQAQAAAAATLRGKITQAERERADAEKRLEDALAADRDPDRAVVTDADIRWMSKH